jgi:hypothetical protein
VSLPARPLGYPFAGWVNGGAYNTKVVLADFLHAELARLVRMLNRG